MSEITRSEGVALALAVFISGALFGFSANHAAWDAWAIENGYAYYDATTGELVYEETQARP